MPARVLPGVDHRSPMEVEGHQGIKDDRGDKCGHAFSQPHCWWAQLVLYLTESGGHCAAMEEHLIAIFKRYARGRCQNASYRALRVTRSAVGRHWVYV